jgi:integrase
MATVLTVKTLENLKPGLARREIPDGLLPGLYFIVQPSGKSSWAVRYRAAGKPRKLTLGAYPAIDLKSARDLAREALANVAGGADPGEEKKASKVIAAIPANDLVEAVAARFVSHYAKRQLKASTAKEVERILDKEVVESWRGRRLSQIGRADIHDLLDDIVERGSPITANRTLAWLRRLCGWAIERGLIITNPCTGIRAPSAETARDRVLNDGELTAVWQAAKTLEQPYAAFVQLLILTGQRRNEVAEMRRQEFDLTARRWTLPKERSKNEREHTVPLSDSAVEILETLPRIGGSDLVFTLNGRNRITAFHLTKLRLDALMPADSAPWTLHDLRRTFASGCARLGVAVHVVEAVLNHRSGSIKGVAAVYNRYSYAAEKQAAMMMWTRHVEMLTTGKPAGNVIELAGRAS